MSTSCSRRTTHVIQTFLTTYLVLATLFIFAIPAADAGRGIRTERIHFKKGVISAVIEAKITG